MSELFDCEEFLNTTLSTDPELTSLVGEIHGYVAKGKFPAIVFSQMSADDTATLGAERVQTVALYLVKAIGRNTGFEGIDAIVNRIDKLLHKSSGTTSEGEVYGCIREKPYSDVEIDGKDTYFHRGGVFRVYIAAK